jgi:hypothetical protein
MEGVSYSTVCDYVAWRLPLILQEAGRGPPPEVPIDQIHKPGAEAGVDFGDVWIDLAEVRTVCYLYVFRMSYSGKAVHRVTASCGQEAFFEGHAHALSVLGGVPSGKVRYDNPKAAVAQVVGFARARVENPRWVAFPRTSPRPTPAWPLADSPTTCSATWPKHGPRAGKRPARRARTPRTPRSARRAGGPNRARSNRQRRHRLHRELRQNAHVPTNKCLVPVKWDRFGEGRPGSDLSCAARSCSAS